MEWENEGIDALNEMGRDQDYCISRPPGPSQFQLLCLDEIPKAYKSLPNEQVAFPRGAGAI